MSTSVHHIAAISSDLKNTIRFYQDFLGLRVIHKQSLFGGPKVCHFYWTEEVESFITFYHCPGLKHAKAETKTIHSISLSVANCSFHFWLHRIKNAGLLYSQQRDHLHSAPVLLIHDPDGLAIKLVFAIKDSRSGLKNGIVPDSFAIKGFYAVDVSARNVASLKRLLVEQFGLCGKELNAGCSRYSNDDLPGSFIDVCSGVGKNDGFTGCGGVHHIALWVDDEEVCSRAVLQIAARREDVISRIHPNLFSSLYFREGDEILFELLGKMPTDSYHKQMNDAPAEMDSVKKKVNCIQAIL